MKKKTIILELKERLDNCIDLYTDLFCEKQEVCADGWIGNIKGGMNCFADAYLSFEDIRLDLELDVPKGMIFRWYWDNIDNPNHSINYYSYTKGLRVENKKASALFEGQIKPIKDCKPFYMVIVEDGVYPPKVKHEKYQDAFQEVLRISKKENKKAFVMISVSQVELIADVTLFNFKENV